MNQHTDIDGLKYQGAMPGGTKSTLHLEALRLASEGVPVFPCEPLTKVPREGSRGFHDATSDPAQINEWWEEKDYNIAYQPQHIGEAVIDIDGPEGEAAWSALELEHGAVETKTVHTPRGGRHLYYKGDLPPSVGKLGAHVDTRGGGSYVLAPPSIFQDPRTNAIGRYRYGDRRDAVDIPEWPAQLLAAMAREHVGAASADLDQPANIARAKAHLKAAVEHGDVAVEGAMGDSRTFTMACELLNLGLSADMTQELMEAHWNPHCQPPWDSDELAVKIENAEAYAQNEQGAWAVEPASVTFAEALGSLGVSLTPVPRQSAHIPPVPAWAKVSQEDWDRSYRKLGFHTHIEGRERQPIECWPGTLIPKATDEGFVGLIVAPSGGGKTTMIGQQAMAVIAAGGRVVYFPGEGGHGLDVNRIPAWQAAYGLTDEQMLANWRTADHIPNLTTLSDVVVATYIYAQWLRETGGLAIFDTLKSGTPGVEENSSAMGDFLASDGAIRAFADAARCTALVAHHLGKNLDKGSRGHSSIEGNADFVQEVKWTKETGALDLHHKKIRDGADGFSTYYQTYGGKDGVPCAKAISADAFVKLKAKRASRPFCHEVGLVLDELRAAHPGQEQVTTDVLAGLIQDRRDRIAVEQAGAADQEYVHDTYEVRETKLHSIKNRLNEKSKPGDGEKAELYDFAVKNESGEIMTGNQGVRLWRPAPRKPLPQPATLALTRPEG